MYGIFTYIWVIYGENVGIHIPYMEHLGYPTMTRGTLYNQSFWVNYYNSLT